MQLKTYDFDVVLKDVSEISDDQADVLFAAGCDDGTPASCNGTAWIHFDREASSLEEAIGTAVAQVQSAAQLAGGIVGKIAAAVRRADRDDSLDRRIRMEIERLGEPFLLLCRGPQIFDRPI